LLNAIRQRLFSKLILTMGVALLVTFSAWAYFNTASQKEKALGEIIARAELLSKGIVRGTHHAMMLNSRGDIHQIIKNISGLNEISHIRIFNKKGEVKFSTMPAKKTTAVTQKEAPCHSCHQSQEPVLDISHKGKTRLFHDVKGSRLLGMASPILNEAGCAAASCHPPPSGQRLLGILDVVLFVKKIDDEIVLMEQGGIFLAGFVFLMTSSIILIFVLRFVNLPIKKLIDGTRQIAKGNYTSPVILSQNDEMGQLAGAINQMGQEIRQQQIALNAQRDEYQTLFERVPCLITVQDRNYRLIKYNREFSRRFDPILGDFCYHAYKGRNKKCPNCQVSKTFEDGQPHYGEETGVNRDGTIFHWIYRTSPIRNAEGEVVAALEMSIDITSRRQLEAKLQESEEKYHEIFTNMPNPVFVLEKKRLSILDCNESAKNDYGYTKEEIIGKSFLDLFADGDRNQQEAKLRASTFLNREKHVDKLGRTIFVNIRISSSANPDKQALLVTTSNITEQLEAEQQLIQSSKLATLGEMSTGVAHELNQPLSVIKTVSSFFIKKMLKKEPISDEILFNMLSKADKNVDRATKIINHMRQFARKSDLQFEKVALADTIAKALEIFNQQLKLRGIQVVTEIAENIPKILADPIRLEQVFINLLLNARDAIEEKWGTKTYDEGQKRITIQVATKGTKVVARMCDSGAGIPDEVRDKIFEPFFTTKDVGKGTGLGLSISYSIVKDCGGEIVAMANPAGGTCFNLSFPVTDMAADEEMI
jgi:histidine kinase